MYDDRLLRLVCAAGKFRDLRGKEEENDMQRDRCHKDAGPLRTRALGPFELKIQFNRGGRKENRWPLAGGGTYFGCIR